MAETIFSQSRASSRLTIALPDGQFEVESASQLQAMAAVARAADALFTDWCERPGKENPQDLPAWGDLYVAVCKFNTGLGGKMK